MKGFETMNRIAFFSIPFVLAAAVAMAQESETSTEVTASPEASEAVELQAEEASPVSSELVREESPSRWRFSVGARFAPGVKTHASTSRRASAALAREMSFSGLEARSSRRSTVATPSSSTVTESTPAASDSGRYEFGDSFIDMNDSAGIAGETWNWNIGASATFDESTGTFSVPSGESSDSSSSLARSSKSHSSDSSETVGSEVCTDDDIWGFDAEIAYDFFRRGGWSVGAVLGFTLYEDADSFRVNGRCKESSSSKTIREVATDTSSSTAEKTIVTDPSYAYEGAAADLLNDDGTYGAGTYDGIDNPHGGYNPVLAVSGVTVEKTTDTDTLTTIRTADSKSSLAVDVASRGSVSTWEARLAIQPAFRVTDWLEVRGTLGAVATHVDVDVDSVVIVNGSARGRISTSDDGFVFAGLCGIDAVVSPLDWLDLFAGADLRLGSNRMDFDTGLVTGDVELSRATYRAGLAARF